MQGITLSVNHQGVSGIVATLKTHHYLSPFSQQINNFTFTLIPPLGSDENYICHNNKFLRRLNHQIKRRPVKFFNPEGGIFFYR